MSNKGVVAPRLPAAPIEYDQRYIDSLLGILRQYFNGLDSPGPIAVATQRRSATAIVAAISASQPGTTPGTTVISMPSDLDLANLRSGDIYYDRSGGVATSYPLRIKA
jgi:hypothetical protein